MIANRVETRMIRNRPEKPDDSMARAGVWFFTPLLPLAVLLLLLLGLTPIASAHKPSDSYLSLTPHEGGWHARWDIALRDLEYAVGLDGNGDGAITWGELQTQGNTVIQYAFGHLTLHAGETLCATRPNTLRVVDHSDGAYAVLDFFLNCPAVGAQTLDYQLFFALDPSHRGLLRVDGPAGTETAVLSPEQRQRTLDAAPASGWQQFASYWKEGIWHIWIGFDHILFLLSLLLPAVGVWPLRHAPRRHGAWQPVDRFGQAFWDVLRIVTAFTVAHSITLTLATLGVLALPSRLVESAIAASVVLAALNNVWPLFHGRRWIVAFGFGLVHGFGFASVLADLGLPQGTLVLALLGFNLGVEAGQLAIVAVFLPLAFAMRRSWLYRRGVLLGGSLLIATIAAAWFVERAFELKLLPF